MLSTQYQKFLNLGKIECELTLDDEDWGRVCQSHLSLMELLESDSIQIYGIHTGYGSNVLSQRPPESWSRNQIELLEYLTVGVGHFLPESVVRRALRLQVLKVVKGYSGIHPDTLNKLLQLSNNINLPNVPCFGSLGASGDLIPMAHAIGPIFKNYEPQGPRDVIGLVNTNSIMSSYAIEGWEKVSTQFRATHRILALVMRAVNTTDDAVSEKVSNLRPENDGYRKASSLIRQDLNCLVSNKLSKKSWLQPRYSIRCAPMVLGNAWDLLTFAQDKILSDAESVADNPLIFAENNNITVAHAGLFYAASTATAADLMNDVVGKICEMLDRQILILMDPGLSEGLPENLKVDQAGHCKGIHQLTSALNQQLRALSTSSRNLSFSSEGNNQDIVPCAMSALNQLHNAIVISEQVIKSAAFVALRAYMIRVNMSLPKSLYLENWPSFNLKDLEKFFDEINPLEIQTY
ncbi:MAG: aromatic amino acid lyase [Bacteriovorax sp.]|nr:aromatic amino acid lyase [Bacteriovorax sp.]